MALPPHTTSLERHYTYLVICALIFLFLIAPVLVIIPLSFNVEPYFTFTEKMLQLDPTGYSMRGDLLLTFGMIAPDAPRDNSGGLMSGPMPHGSMLPRTRLSSAFFPPFWRHRWGRSLPLVCRVLKCPGGGRSWPSISPMIVLISSQRQGCSSSIRRSRSRNGRFLAGRSLSRDHSGACDAGYSLCHHHRDGNPVGFDHSLTRLPPASVPGLSPPSGRFRCR